MNRIKPTVEDVEAVKSQKIQLKQKKSVPASPNNSGVDLHCGVVRDGAEGSVSPTPLSPEREIERFPFPTDSFPPAFAEMIRETARVVGVPESLPGVTMLGVISAILGAGIEGRCLPGKITSPNLYTLLGAESGVGKSETARFCMAPIFELETDLREPWERDMLPGLVAQENLLVREIQILTRGVKTTLAENDRAALLDKLKCKQKCLNSVRDDLEGGGPTLIVEDVTSQALAVQFQQNNETLACISSDGGDVVNNILGRNHKLDRVDDSLIVKAFSGDRVKVHRIGRPIVVLQKPRLTMVLMVQPDKIKTLFGTQALIDGGLLPRFLPAMTDAVPTHIAEDKLEFATSVNNNYKQSIGDLFKEFRLPEPTYTVETSPEARRALIKFCNDVVDRHHSEYAGISSFSARYAEQACRISLVLHAAKHGRDAVDRAIDLDTARNAIVLTKYFIQEQLAILQATRADFNFSQSDRVVAFARENGGSVKVRDLQRKRFVPNAQAGTTLMAELVAAGLFSSDSTTLNGRTLTNYKLK